jgi:colanic acid/amylovoran biosynthesis glycosyltransferase
LNYRDGRLLLVLPLRAYAVKNRFFIDSQACDGLTLWLKHFSRVTLICPTEYPGEPPKDTSPIDLVDGADRLTFVSLPAAYTPWSFLARLPKAIKLLTEHISKAEYLHFAIGGLWGDWASVACLLARRANCPYAVWTDRVESQVTEFSSRSKTGIRRLYTFLNAQLMRLYERHLIKRCALGLFHGMDCFRAYSPFCSNSHLVHDIHLGLEAHIRPTSLTNRLDRAAGDALRIVYAGRVHAEKGVFDWIDALSVAAKRNVAFHATWFGAQPKVMRSLSATSRILMSLFSATRHWSLLAI